MSPEESFLIAQSIISNSVHLNGVCLAVKDLPMSWIDALKRSTNKPREFDFLNYAKLTPLCRIKNDNVVDHLWLINGGTLTLWVTQNVSNN